MNDTVQLYYMHDTVCCQVIILRTRGTVPLVRLCYNRDAIREHTIYDEPGTSLEPGRAEKDMAGVDPEGGIRMGKMSRILVAEDDEAIRELLRQELLRAGYECRICPDGETAADALEKETFDLAVLDIMLPGIDGFDLLSWCRQQKVPVIFLTAKGMLKDRVAGLRAGAEDYITKPFAVEELISRMEVVLRRFGKGVRYLEWKDLMVDLDSFRVFRNGEEIILRVREFELLSYLLQNRNVLLSRERIYEAVWKQEYTGDTRTIDLHIQRVRNKVGLGDSLRTVYRMGYMLVDAKQGNRFS